MAKIYAFPTPNTGKSIPSNPARQLQKQYVFVAGQTSGDILFVTTEVRRLSIVEEHISEMVTFASDLEYSVGQKYSMKALCDQLLRLRKDRDLDAESTALVREFLSRLDTARFFMHNLEFIPET